MVCDSCGISRSDITDGCCTRPSCLRTVLVARTRDLEATRKLLVSAEKMLAIVREGLESLESTFKRTL